MSQHVRTGESLFDFFNGSVTAAHEEAGLDLSADTLLYLSQLLAERTRADRPTSPESTLAALHARAANAPPSEQARTYRELGDRALYAVGFFAESLERRRRLVGRSYYTDMGAGAYHRAAMVFQRWFSDAFGDTFRELAVHFGDCAQLITEVRDHHQRAAGDLLELYRRWLATGDEAIERALVERGVVLNTTRGLVQ
jgi:hypothetical protein